VSAGSRPQSSILAPNKAAASGSRSEAASLQNASVSTSSRKALRITVYTAKQGAIRLACGIDIDMSIEVTSQRPSSPDSAVERSYRHDGFVELARTARPSEETCTGLDTGGPFECSGASGQLTEVLSVEIGDTNQTHQNGLRVEIGAPFHLGSVQHLALVDDRAVGLAISRRDVTGLVCDEERNPCRFIMSVTDENEWATLHDACSALELRRRQQPDRDDRNTTFPKVTTDIIECDGTAVAPDLFSPSDRVHGWHPDWRALTQTADDCTSDRDGSMNGGNDATAIDAADTAKLRSRTRRYRHWSSRIPDLRDGHPEESRDPYFQLGQHTLIACASFIPPIRQDDRLHELALEACTGEASH
jgi:hypothetical protein